MKLKNTAANFLPVTLSIIAILFIISSYAQKPEEDFWPIKGNVKTHHLTEMGDSLSYELIEALDEKGMPRWFYRDVYKGVCLTGECRMIHVWLIWDAVGNFHGLQLHENEPFTKTNHTAFKPEDYQKLQRILSDSMSVLKTLKQEDLIILPNKMEGLVDGNSGATQESLKEYLVEHAAYTCYTLWHTVYGNSRTDILKLIEKQADSSFLQRLFDQNNPGYTTWTIEFIKRHPQYHASFYHQILNHIKSKDDHVAKKAMSYFDSELLNSPVIQKELVSIFDEISYQRKFDFLWNLSTLQRINDDVVLSLLKLFKDQKINTSMVGYVFKLIHAENLENPLIVEKLKPFEQHTNLYIRKITQNVFAKAKN